MNPGANLGGRLRNEAMAARNALVQPFYYGCYPYLRSFDRGRFVFVHNPKTGGKSIFRAIGYPWNVHATALDYLRADPRRFDSYFKFAFVRDPWSRCYSAYHYVRRERPDNLEWLRERRGIRTSVDFETFVNELLDGFSIWAMTVLRPQVHYLCDAAGNVMVNRVLRYEKIAEEFGEIAPLLGSSRVLPHVNRNPHNEDYRSVYTKRMIARVADLYAADVATFGYRF